MDILKLFRTLIISWMVTMLVQPVIAQNPKTLQKAFGDSYALESKGDYKDAYENLKKFYDDSSYELNLRLGWLSYLNGMQNESLSYYQKAMDLMPYAIEPCFGYAYPAAALGKWDDVVKLYDKILTIDSGNTLALYRKGLIFYNKGNFTGAEPLFEKVVNLYPFDYDGLIMLAWTKLKLQKMQEARLLFQKALLNRPSDKSAKEGLELIR